ncbi:hypothetical protein TNCV_1430901 [Trichonephila clavipes]|nr:hypothetical protein TNCV_1430901 [Trichonephila clavipes]
MDIMAQRCMFQFVQDGDTDFIAHNKPFVKELKCTTPIGENTKIIVILLRQNSPKFRQWLFTSENSAEIWIAFFQRQFFLGRNDKDTATGLVRYIYSTTIRINLDCIIGDAVNYLQC